ncbi:MAG: hypothetical protein ACREYF_29225 [Gammaproteobacteria bacterium]
MENGTESAEFSWGGSLSAGVPFHALACHGPPLGPRGGWQPWQGRAKAAVKNVCGYPPAGIAAGGAAERHARKLVDIGVPTEVFGDLTHVGVGSASVPQVQYFSQADSMASG